MYIKSNMSNWQNAVCAWFDLDMGLYEIDDDDNSTTEEYINDSQEEP